MSLLSRSVIALGFQIHLGADRFVRNTIEPLVLTLNTFLLMIHCQLILKVHLGIRWMPRKE